MGGSVGQDKCGGKCRDKCGRAAGFKARAIGNRKKSIEEDRQAPVKQLV
jgi:hypothetical protein